MRDWHRISSTSLRIELDIRVGIVVRNLKCLFIAHAGGTLRSLKFISALSIEQAADIVAGKCGNRT